jgi:calmodulin
MSNQALRDRFDGYDRDKNGKLDEAELAQLLDELGAGFTESQVHAAFQSIDVNGDGQIDFDEFGAWYTS